MLLRSCRGGVHPIVRHHERILEKRTTLDVKVIFNASNKNATGVNTDHTVCECGVKTKKMKLHFIYFNFFI